MLLHQPYTASMAAPQMLFGQIPLERRELIIGVSRQKEVNVLVAIHQAISRQLERSTTRDPGENL
jgi:hypothetical protein